MKRIVLLTVAIFMAVYGYGQSKSELKAKVEELSAIIESLQEQIHELNQQNKSLVMQINEIKQFVNNYPNVNRYEGPNSIGNSIEESTSNESERQQCAAITKDGTRCLRMAQEGSRYCWQHLKKLRSTPTSSSSTSYDSGRVWHIGPRGGQYYINSNGNKVYKKR